MSFLKDNNVEPLCLQTHLQQIFFPSRKILLKQKFMATLILETGDNGTTEDPYLTTEKSPKGRQVDSPSRLIKVTQKAEGKFSSTGVSLGIPEFVTKTSNMANNGALNPNKSRLMIRRQQSSKLSL